MTTSLGSIRDLAHLESLVAGSFDRPLVIFKHSLSCGTSHQAYDEIQDHLAAGAHDATYVMLTVQAQRDLSDAVARHFSVRHETPQVLVIRDGAVAWTASHFRVTATAVAAAVDAAKSAAAGA